MVKTDRELLIEIRERLISIETKMISQIEAGTICKRLGWRYNKLECCFYDQYGCERTWKYAVEVYNKL